LSKKPQSQAIKARSSRFAVVRDIIDELKKVVWPSRKETTRLTLMVIALVIVMGIFLGALDFGFSQLVAKVFLGGK
jgi:preprotein translocase subunit SecE